MRAYAVLFIGVVSISFAAVFVRLADAPSLVIAAYRLVIASMLLTPFAMGTRWGEFRRLRISDLALPILAGGFLALHFGLWIASLKLTSVASSVVLVTAHPIFVAVAAPLVTNDRFSGGALRYAAVAVVGAGIIGIGDFTTTVEAFRGDMLALGGGAAAGCYFILGRRAAEGMPLLAYLAITYSTAAVLLAIGAEVLRLPVTGYSGKTYVMFALLALVPQLIGHSSLNWALRRLSTAFVATSIVGEPVVATALALAVLRESPPVTSVMGGAVVVVAILLAMREERVSSKSRGGQGAR